MNTTHLYSAHAVMILERLIAEYGTQTLLAQALSRHKYRDQPSCQQQYISTWIRRGYIAADWVIAVERVANKDRAVTDRTKLAPAIFDDKHRGRRR